MKTASSKPRVLGGHAFPLSRSVLTGLTITVYLLIVLNFIIKNEVFSEALIIISLGYATLLVIEITKKELRRHRSDFRGKSDGELFVSIWTIIVVGVILLGNGVGKENFLPTEIYLVYIVVLTLYFLTKKSKLKQNSRTPGKKPVEQKTTRRRV